MGTRRNLMTNAAAHNAFVRGVGLLKAEFPGPTTTRFGIVGPSRPISTYDLFVVWHHLAMMRMTPPGQGDRNAAHSGPSFLPWHRLMLMLFEMQLQRVLADTTFGLPYWDWAADGDRPTAQQPLAPIWTANGVGGSGAPINDGPFTPAKFRVAFESDPTGRFLRTADRGLKRDLGTDTATLPTTAQVQQVLSQTGYDVAPWDRTSTGFRNRLEGWRPTAPGLHNRVHGFVGGDMAPATSPNDPVFFLNHCNVDRIWESWMTRHGRVYVPPANAPAALTGHRLDDTLYSLLIRQPFTPAGLLDVATRYTYETLP